MQRPHARTGTLVAMVAAAGIVQLPTAAIVVAVVVVLIAAALAWRARPQVEQLPEVPAGQAVEAAGSASTR